MTGLRLYGVVRAGAEPPARTRTVVLDDIAAVVGDMAEPELTDEDASEHLDVLCALVAREPVVPLVFGTVAPDEDSVRDEVLASGHADFAAMLEALDGKVELRVTLTFDEQQLLREVLTESNELRDMTSGTKEIADQVAIGEVAVRELTARAQARGEESIAPLVAVADSARRLEPNEPSADTWAFLVDHTDLSTMDDLVAGLRRAESGVEITYLGPLPALTFVDAAASPAQTGSSNWGW